jgi:hypothetical protein
MARAEAPALMPFAFGSPAPFLQRSVAEIFLDSAAGRRRGDPDDWIASSLTLLAMTRTTDCFVADAPRNDEDDGLLRRLRSSQ